MATRLQGGWGTWPSAAIGPIHEAGRPAACAASTIPRLKMIHAETKAAIVYGLGAWRGSAGPVGSSGAQWGPVSRPVGSHPPPSPPFAKCRRVSWRVNKRHQCHSTTIEPRPGPSSARGRAGAAFTGRHSAKSREAGSWALGQGACQSPALLCRLQGRGLRPGGWPTWLGVTPRRVAAVRPCRPSH